MKTRLGFLPLATVAALLAHRPAHAEEVSFRAVALVEEIAPRKNQVFVGLTDEGKFQPLGELPPGAYGLAVHASTGRWVLSASPNGEAALPKLGGKASPAPAKVATLVFGQEKGILDLAPGDAKCKDPGCFEGVVGFGKDGDSVVVESLTNPETRLSRYAFAAPHKRTPVLERRGAVQPRLDADERRVVYMTEKEGLFIEEPAAKVKAVRLVKPALLMDAPMLLSGKRLYYFRREPVEQRQGFIEAWDLEAKKALPVFTLPMDYPMWNEGFFQAGAQVLFVDATKAPAGGALWAFATATLEPRKVAEDVVRVLDVSADGRAVLVVRRKDPKRGDYADNPERLVLLSVEDGKVLGTVDTGVAGARIKKAGLLAHKAPAGN
jgi:hypothetical protein